MAVVPRSNHPRRRGYRTREVASSSLPRSTALRPGFERLERQPDGVYVVRRISGAGSERPYRCPGCDQEIRPGTPHVVAWSAEPIGGFGGVGDRRHWHSPCWSARGRRR